MSLEIIFNNPCSRNNLIQKIHEIKCKKFRTSFTLVRTFNAVGQGAFYSELFKCGLKIIYDCGSNSSIEYVKREINHIYNKGDAIHALFLSHLDDDHINGIPFLLQYCKVERIYFPLISNTNKKFMKIALRLERASKFAISFLDNPQEAIVKLFKNKFRDEFPIDFLEAEPASSPTEINFFGIEEVEPDNGKENNNVKKIQSGENILQKDFESLENDKQPLLSEWVYVPFNFEQSKRVSKLIENLKNEFKFHTLSDEAIANKVEKLWETGTEQDKKKIKEAYKGIQGSFNANSMTLFSGFNVEMQKNDSSKPSPNSMEHNSFPFICYKRNGCLYTGDYEAASKKKWRDLYHAYQNYWDVIGYVQLPHHGSRKNFNDEFLKMDSSFIISAGIYNTYGHPDSDVIKKILKQKKEVFLVNEIPSSRIHLFLP